MIEVQVKNKISVKHARARLGLSQRQLAILATDEHHKVSPSAISDCEEGKPVRLLTAYAILNGLNKAHQQKGWALLNFEDVAWTLSGEQQEH